MTCPDRTLALGFSPDNFIRDLALIWAMGQNFGRQIKGPLRSAPVVKHRHLLDAGDSAEFRARLFSVKLMLQVFQRVLFERDAGESALLRAIMDKAVFADI